MTDQYRVDLDHLKDVTTRMEGLNAFVEQSLAEIDERIATVQGSWNGLAADAHATAHAEWVASATKIRDSLAKMHAAAAAANTNYEAASAANLAMLGRGGATTQ